MLLNLNMEQYRLTNKSNPLKTYNEPTNNSLPALKCRKDETNVSIKSFHY